MKKTFQVNINGSIFYIDEDAYNLLNNYLNQLRQAFPGGEGAEIVGDIEARISELFAEIIAGGARVITIDDVNSVIEQMGRPSDLSDTVETDGPDEADGDGRPSSKGTPPPFPGIVKKLYRNIHNKVFGGVLGGIACYMGWNANILRLLVFILALCTYVWPLIVIYLLAWMVIPAAVTPRQMLEMQGAPVTVGSVGQTIIGTADPNASGRSAGLLGALGNTVLMFLCFIAGLVAIGALVMFVKLLCGLILYCGWDANGILYDTLGRDMRGNLLLGAVGAICLAVCIALPAIAIVWALLTAVFKVKRAPKGLVVSGIIIEILLIVAATVLLSVSKIPAPDDFEVYRKIHVEVMSSGIVGGSLVSNTI